MASARSASADNLRGLAAAAVLERTKEGGAEPVDRANPAREATHVSSPTAASRRPDGLLNGAFFSSQVKSEAELNGLRQRYARHLQPAAREGIVSYYRDQNDTIASFREAEDALLSEGGGRTGEGRRGSESGAEFAMHLSFGCNVILFIMKLVVCAMSGSLSLIASALDSFLDLLSGAILWHTNRQMQQSAINKDSYPAGASRMQPLGILVFSCIMGTVGFQVLVEGVRQLVGPSHVHHFEDLVLGVVIIVAVVIIKFFLYLYCRKFENEEVRTYAQDHFNDVVTNSVGLACAVAGDRIAYWIDPLGAILLAAHITRIWGNTALENMRALVGVSAPPRLLNKLTFIVWNAHPSIRQIDTIRAYTFGPKHCVEVDIVLDPEMPLREAHDIGQALQDRIETLDEVERAFVHLDWESNHAPEH